MLHEVETNIGKSVFSDYSDGEKQTHDLFNQSGVFLAPKHANFVSRFVMHRLIGSTNVAEAAVMRYLYQESSAQRENVLWVGDYRWAQNCNLTTPHLTLWVAYCSNFWRGYALNIVRKSDGHNYNTNRSVAQYC